MIIIIYRLSLFSSASVLFFLSRAPPRACVWKGNQRDMTGGGRRAQSWRGHALCSLCVMFTRFVRECRAFTYTHTHTNKTNK
mmetsp:Transcript_11724/g.25340  ORF Transcript_11724/g.25340 Transcript_11724/m.25340 type:complete len:82 (+) Transcript_11724:809-1054(+)